MVTTRNSTKGAKSSKISIESSRQAPEKLEPKQVTLFRLLFVVCLTVLLPLGIYGLAVMMDDEHKSKWYSNNQLGIYWRWLVYKNPMSLAACFNGGLFGILYSTFKLHSHNQALKLEKGSPKKTN